MNLVMTPFDTYKQYLAYKNHFTKEKYDYHRYGGKSRAKIDSFYKRKDRYWFEKTSRKYSDAEIVNFLLANFVTTDNPKNLWIGEIINSGERTYSDWMKRQQSMSYMFKEQSNELLDNNNLDKVLECKKGHPIILKRFLGGDISLETFVIFDIIFAFSESFDKKLKDPVWETVSLKIKKYKPFLNINVFQFKKILREIINE